MQMFAKFTKNKKLVLVMAIFALVTGAVKEAPKAVLKQVRYI